MREQLAEAALLVVVGMAVVMIALAILMLAIMLMNRVFPGKKVSGEQQMIKLKEGNEPAKESIAAIAVALALAMKEQEAGNISGHGDSSVSAPVVSRWSATGRQRLMASRGKREPKPGKPSR